jgi:glycosyltransferase involved in cell wall biosynthesis
VRVAFVHDWLTGMRGGEKCLEKFCHLFPDSEILTLLHRRGALSTTIESRPITTSGLQYLPGWRHYYRYLLPLFPRIAERLRIPKCDLIISLSHCVAKSVMPPSGIPHVCYCFTPMRYAWHQREHYFTDNPRTPKAWLRNRILARLREWDKVSSDRVSHFIAISETVRHRIKECYDRDSILVYPPVDTEYYELSTALRENYYLVVSAFAPYKRIDHAVAACSQLKRKLIVIGAGPDAKRIRKIGGPTVEFLGWQSDSDIRKHYQRCSALLFPGEEDFGIVPVEAQACGAPVIALGRGGATETVSPGTGLLYHQPTVDGLVNAIEQFESMRDIYEPIQCRRNAERFGVSRFDHEIRKCIDDIINAPTPLRRAA